ncbi:DUF2125 domain-containing protein [Seohaeicola saemankumensis]|nr:DUF2125 domain-containing protein [Seohaeicola saemankumensis]MCA0871555.1 DUF2125 domain-containing protein [Seohaeicola saemankumensis]
MMRLVKIAIVLGLLWSGYWFAAGYGLRSSIAGWFATQQARGWQADYADMSTSGFPLHHVTTLTSPALADPRTGAAWQADWLHLQSPAIWPGQQTLMFADTPQRLSYFDQTAVIEAQDMVAALRLHPGVALELDSMALTSGPWTIIDENGAVARADSLTASMVQTTGPETYDFLVDAQEFSPGTSLRRLLRGAPSLPAAFETLKLDMSVTFDRSWDRSALEDRRPQPHAITLRLADLHWGALRLLAAGQVTVDETGMPTGEVTLKADNWREMLAMAQAAGAIPPQAASPAERVLNMLAGVGGNPNALDVTLGFRNGYVTLGPLPLGPAPRLILR